MDNAISANIEYSSTEMLMDKFFEKVIDKKKLSEKLDISPSYINKLMSQEGLPHFKIGRSVRFKVSEVLTWLQQRRMP